MIRIHGSIQIPTTQVSQIKGLAVGLVRRYGLMTRPIRKCDPTTLSIPMKLNSSDVWLTL